PTEDDLTRESVADEGGDALAGPVGLRGPDTTGGDDEGGVLPGAAQRRQDTRQRVAHLAHADQFDTQRRHRLRHDGGRAAVAAARRPRGSRRRVRYPAPPSPAPGRWHWCR